MRRLGAGESLRRPKIPCSGEENPCPGKKNSLRRKDREFAASHWKCDINSFRNRRLCAQSERIRCQNSLPQGISEPILSARIA
jgi:hypothetical protein